MQGNSEPSTTQQQGNGASLGSPASSRSINGPSLPPKVIADHDVKRDKRKKKKKKGATNSFPSEKPHEAINNNKKLEKMVLQHYTKKYFLKSYFILIKFT